MSRVVVLAPWLPLPADFGGAIRTLNLLRQLAERHEVTLLSPVRKHETPHVVELGQICDVTTVPVAWTPRHPAGPAKRIAQARSILSRRSYLERSTRSAQLQLVLDRLFLTGRVDIVVYESTRMALHRPPVPCATLIDAHDVEADLLRRVAAASDRGPERALKAAEARKVGWLERRLWRAVDGVVATSGRDAALIEAVSGVPARVVPNGVDVLHFCRPAGWPSRGDIVFTGVMRHQPNSDAARWYLDEIHPLVRERSPGARVVFAGADPPSWLQDRATDDIVVTGRVDDIRPWLWSAALAIVPLRSGGGTRLKILEAFAAGVPVVSTPLGAEGLDGIEDAAVIAAGPKPFAEAVVEVLTNPARAAQLRDNAARAVAAYDWASIGDRLAVAIDEAIDRFAARQTGTDATTMDWSGRLWRSR